MIPLTRVLGNGQTGRQQPSPSTDMLSHTGEGGLNLRGADQQQVRNSVGIESPTPSMASGLIKRWVDEAVSAPIRPVRRDRPSPRVFEALLGVLRNVSEIARCRAMG